MLQRFSPGFEPISVSKGFQSNPHLGAPFLVALLLMGLLFMCEPVEAAVKIPLCPGMTIVTAINQSDSDYESIKTIEKIDSEFIRIRYASERMVFDWLSPDPPKLVKSTVYRNVRQSDVLSASLYLQQFDEVLPELIPETTAIGISKDLFDRLKKDGTAEMGIFIPFAVDRPGVDRNKHPNVYDNQMIAMVSRASEDVPMNFTLNDQPIEVPAMRIEGDFYGDKSEFFVLDDPDNPLMLKFRIGINANAPLTADEVEQHKLLGLPTTISPDKEVLQVVKIEADCPADTGKTAPQSPAETSSLEGQLETNGRADVQAIYFSVNSSEIRPESEPALVAIASMLIQHGNWRVSINGHTDSQADDAYNLALSRSRAEAVKAALTDRYGIAATRLETAGYGETRPVADNAKLEGRARNRRVELVKL